MNKALPWNINGVGFDAREAAREAARRQGKSLGEWLHDVIADHADARGVPAQDFDEQDRIEAVSARLERFGAGDDLTRRRQPGRAADRAPPTRHAYEDEEPARRRPLGRGTDAMRRPARAASLDETEYLLDAAIDSVERRAERAERRADTAMANVARLLEDNEARRERDREALRDLTQKLNAIESQLTSRDAEPNDETPVQGALARLEARLETIAQRSSAEATARLQAGRPLVERRAEAEPMRRLEDKLNVILEAVAAKPTEGRAGRLPPGLGKAIAEISRRQQALEMEGEAPSPAPAKTAAPRVAVPVRTDAPEPAWQAALGSMQNELARLTSKIEQMRAPQVPVTAPATPVGHVDTLRDEMDSMSGLLRELAPRGDVAQLQQSVDALARRVERSRDEGVREGALRPVETALRDLNAKLPGIDPRPVLGQLERDVKTLAEKVDRISDAHTPAFSRIQSQMQEIRDLIAQAAARPVPVEAIERQVSALTERLDRLPLEPAAAQGLGPAVDTIRSLVAAIPGEDALEKIEQRLERLGHRLDDAMQRPPAASQDVAGLERLVRELTTRIEATQKPGSDPHALDALQRQVETLAERLEHSHSGLASLGTLERTMRDLFGQIEATRESVETSAAKAAREALRIAVDEGRGREGAAIEADALKAIQRETDQRMHSTLTAVHQTLEHVVGRMSTMEADLDKVRRAPAAAEPPRAMPSPAVETPAAAPRVDIPRTAQKTASRDPLFASLEAQLDAPIRPPTESARTAAKARPKPSLVAETEAGRTAFIAAARRAAKSVQSDPSVLALTRPVPNDESRVGLIERSRDYVATHKRPVLLSIAAVFVVLGTMAIVQRMAFNTSDPEVAALDAPAAVESVTPAPDKMSAKLQSGDLTPSALPTGARALAAQIPGSDPTPTGAIQSLPSFAAQGAAPPPPSAVSAGLMAAAAGGDASAQYELGARYADGRAVARDFKSAAGWFQKAADQGLAPAQYRLAALYEKGLGVAQDKRHARALYLRAAEAGNPRAMHNLAVLLADGDGKPDYAAAATWFRKAAQYGVHDSQYNLAILLARGLGVDQSLVQSYQWFAVAARQDDADAAKKRDEVGDRLSANDLAVAKALAASFQPKSANTAAIDIAPPPGGWDSVGSASHINSARSKISSL